MKKAPLLITISIVILTAGAFYGYQYFLNRKPLAAWDLVPADALIVYEKNDCAECATQITTSTVWKLIESAFFQKSNDDSLSVKLFESVKNNRQALVSAHATKKDDLDLIYYLPENGSSAALLNVPAGSKYKSSARILNGIEIHEIRFSAQVFSFTKIGNVWVGSFTPFLIEDVIRSHVNDKATSTLSKPSGFNMIKDDGGNIYVRLDHFSDFISLFVPHHSLSDLTLGKSAALDVKATSEEVVLNGFSVDSVDQSKYLLSVFGHQSPVSFTLKNLISNRAVAVTSYGVSDGSAFYKDLHTLKYNPRKVQFDSLNKALSGKVDLQNLFSLVNDEIAVCFFESIRQKNFSKVLLIETNKVTTWLSAFDKIADHFSVDSVFYEAYAGHKIGQVPIFRFPQKLLSPLVSGFDHTYYTNHGNVMIMSENLEELKSFLDDIEAEDTWGRSVSRNHFLESTLLESNISVYVNIPRVINISVPTMHTRWQTFVRNNQRLVQAFQLGSIQFSHLNNSYYTNALLTFKPFTGSKIQQAEGKQIITQFEKPLVNVYAVRSHVNRSNEILVQDSTYDLTLVAADGKALWKLPIGGKIISDVMQIDYFGNGKLQYFFSTKDAVHIIDRLGNYVASYPLHFNDLEIEHVSIVDYDNSKNYRILVADVEGKLRMFDKEGKPLLGWEPNDAKGSLAMPPRHYRILGKDYIVAVRKDGLVYQWNRRGELSRNFPVETGSLPVGDIALERSNNLGETSYVIIATDGYRIRVNPLGKILNKETLPKTSVFSGFALINENNSKSYVIFQQDEKHIEISGEQGTRLLSYPLTRLTSKDVVYYNFGGGKIYFTIRDKAQGFCYVFDGDGKLLTEPPIEADAIELRLGANDQLTAFFIRGNSLVIQLL